MPSPRSSPRAERSEERKGNNKSKRRDYYSDEDESDFSDDYSSDEDDYSHGRRGGGGGGRGGKSSQRMSQSKQSSPRQAAKARGKVVPSSNSSRKDVPPVGAATCMGVVFVGLKKFFVTHDNVQHSDFDNAISTMALMCTLMLIVPFHVATSLGSHYLDDLTTQTIACHGEQGVTYERIYSGYRAILLITVYSSLCGMILSLFFFLFKRTDPVEYRLWHPKARAMTILVFFFTSFALCGIITLLNWLFDYYILASKANVCDNGTTNWVFPGLLVAGFTYFLGFFLIL